MAKRLTDTDKWKKPFIKELPVEYKLFWLYILDDCDHAGVWQVDVEVAEIRLGTKLSIQKAQGYFKKILLCWTAELNGSSRILFPFSMAPLMKKIRCLNPLCRF
jgi:hypothetical protein